MALFEELPIFRVAYELLRSVYRLSSKMSRAYRFTLGESLQSDAKALLLCIYEANSNFDKSQSLAEARKQAIAIQLLLRVAHDEGEIDSKSYLRISDILQNTNRQLTAWHKSQKDPPQPSPQGIAETGQPQGIAETGQPQGIAETGQPQGIAPTRHAHTNSRHHKFVFRNYATLQHL